jgi:hypothetical protein
MKREADKNRVKRAIEHLNAAKAHLDSIKYANLEIGDHGNVGITKYDITCCIRKLNELIKEDEK